MVTNEEHFSDKLANVLIYSRVDDALEKIVKAYQKKIKEKQKMEKIGHE